MGRFSHRQPLYLLYTKQRGDAYEFRKQFISSKEKEWIIPGGSGWEAGREQTDDFELGDETLPDICQSKKLALLYHLSLDELIEFDIDLKEIEQVIEHTSEETEKKVDWTKVWGKKYPILTTYQNEVDINEYTPKLREMLDSLKKNYGYNDVDAGLVLKDILAQVWK